ncbi:MAG: adenylate/guanylate cyclase domain-containing protein [Armatimonadetes bacterium]|nr:adenylate/guanylate cyclase domain-containing protein [Armatimonadota bacterium]
MTRRIAVVTLVSLLISLGVLFVLRDHPFTRIPDQAFLGYVLKKNAHRGTDPRIVIAAIDKESLDRLPRYGTSRVLHRRCHARALKILKEAGARVIVVDLIFARSLPVEDAELARSLREAGNVVLALGAEKGKVPGGQLELAGYRFIQPTKVLRDEAAALGSPEVWTGNGGLAGEIQILQEGNKEPAFPLALQALSLYEGVPLSPVTCEKDKVHMGGLTIPFYSTRDRTVLIRWAEPNAFDRISYHQICRKEFPPEKVRDRIVLLGAVDDPADVQKTPIGDRVPGVDVQASALSTLLNRDFAVDFARAYPGAGFFYPLICAAVASTIAVTLPPLLALACVGLEAACLFLLAALAFQKLGLVVEITPGLTAIVCATATALLEGIRARGLLETFAAPRVVRALLGSGAGRHKREVTVLFSDICNYTGLSESLDPSQLMTLLNEYFEEMEKIIARNGGVVNKYIGDAIMAIFGDPDPLPDHALRALRSALEMRKALTILHEKWLERSLPSLEIGIGINTGEVEIGKLGSSRRWEYGAIGDAVNVASRLEHLTREKGYPILMSKATYDKTAAGIEAISLGSLDIRGKEASVEVFAVKE